MPEATPAVLDGLPIRESNLCRILEIHDRIPKKDESNMRYAEMRCDERIRNGSLPLQPNGVPEPMAMIQLLEDIMGHSRLPKVLYQCMKAIKRACGIPAGKGPILVLRVPSSIVQAPSPPSLAEEIAILRSRPSLSLAEEIDRLRGRAARERIADSTKPRIHDAGGERRAAGGDRRAADRGREIGSHGKIAVFGVGLKGPARQLRITRVEPSPPPERAKSFRLLRQSASVGLPRADLLGVAPADPIAEFLPKHPLCV